MNYGKSYESGGGGIVQENEPGVPAQLMMCRRKTGFRWAVSAREEPPAALIWAACSSPPAVASSSWSRSGCSAVVSSCPRVAWW